MISIVFHIGKIEYRAYRIPNSLRISVTFMQMTVTWTSGYNIDEAVPFVEWGFKGRPQVQALAGTLTFKRNAMCGTNLLWPFQIFDG